MIITTPNGSLRGQDEDGVAVFRGIPYAGSPTGDRRFLAPEPTKAWEGVRDALDFGPKPPQSQAWSASEPTGDDWLTVNVWTPDTSASLPVIVWAYGGAYRGGSSSDPQYDGASLASQGVVIVTANHRVGMEGYGLIEGAPANRGILDQIEVLRWVRANIASFGGDPTAVTIMGESAGAGSTAAILAAPAATGLFRRMILQSAPGFAFSHGLGAQVGDAIAAVLGRTRHRDDLVNVPTAELEAAADAVAASLPRRDEWRPLTQLPTPFAPVIGDDALPHTVFEALWSGAAADIDLLVTHTRTEGRIFLAMAGKLGTVSDDDAERAINLLSPHPDVFRGRHAAADPQQQLETVLTDWMFRVPTERIAALHAAAGGKAFLAEFDWTPSGSAGGFGPTHATDVPLVFGNPPATMPGAAPYEADDRYHHTSSAVQRAWLRFATEGEPGWKDYATGSAVAVTDDGLVPLNYQETYPAGLWEEESYSPI